MATGTTTDGDEQVLSVMHFADDEVSMASVAKGQFADGMAYDKLRQIVYFSDQDSAVYKMTLDGQVTTLYSTLGSPRGMDLDPSSELLYWVDSDNAAVMRAPTSGRGDVETLFAGLMDMRDVKLQFDSTTGECAYLYVSTALTNEIYRATCDGGDAELFTAGFNKVVGLVVDPSSEAVFWADSTEVHTANMTSGAYIGMVASGFSGLSYLDLDLVHGRLFVADTVGGVLWGVDLRSHETWELIDASSPRGFGLQVNATAAEIRSKYVQYKGVSV